jgi:hypothetical protein
VGLVEQPAAQAVQLPLLAGRPLQATLLVEHRRSLVVRVLVPLLVVRFRLPVVPVGPLELVVQSLSLVVLVVLRVERAGRPHW